MLAWLYPIAQRRFADEVRRRRHSTDGLPLDDFLEELPAPEYDSDITAVLGEAISRLPLSQRQVIAMKLLRGASFSNAATELEVSEAAAKMRFRRALQVLSADLEQ